MLISESSGKEFDFLELSKIENDRLDVRDGSYDWFCEIFCALFDLDVDWIEQIRQQTELQPHDFSQAIFPVYVKEFS